MKVTYLKTNTGARHHCPNCTSTNWLRDNSDVDGIQLRTVSPCKPGNLGCNDCGRAWTPAD